MTNQNQTPPEYKKNSFTCPYCGVYAQQTWGSAQRATAENERLRPVGHLITARCTNCRWCSIWRDDEMIYPLISSAPKPENNMPVPVRELYEEASLVSIHSSRAAAALLRVALEKLTEHLGETEGSLNTRIGNLRKQGLPDSVIKSLDIVRITANSGGAHAGIIDLTGADGVDIVNRLFKLVNFIIQMTINVPNEVDEMFGDLPEVKRKGAEARDKPTPGEKIQ